jgi:hypothetical protein
VEGGGGGNVGSEDSGGGGDGEKEGRDIDWERTACPHSPQKRSSLSTGALQFEHLEPVMSSPVIQ